MCILLKLQIYMALYDKHLNVFLNHAICFLMHLETKSIPFFLVVLPIHQACKLIFDGCGLKRLLYYFHHKKETFFHIIQTIILVTLLIFFYIFFMSIMICILKF